MVTVQCWTGAETKALRQAMRLSIRAFAAHLGIDARTVNKWEARRGTITLRPDTQALAIDAAEAALNTASHKASRVSAVAMTYAAHAHALNGNKASCERSYAMSQDLAAQLKVDPTSPWALFFNHSYIEVQRVRSLTTLGEYGAAIELFQKAISCLPRGYRRDCGVYLAREAAAHMGHGDVEQACVVGLQALAIGAETRSARIIRELKHLDTAMRSFPSSASMVNFHEAMHSTFSPSEPTGFP